LAVLASFQALFGETLILFRLTQKQSPLRRKRTWDIGVPNSESGSGLDRN